MRDTNLRLGNLLSIAALSICIFFAVQSTVTGQPLKDESPKDTEEQPSAEQTAVFKELLQGFPAASPETSPQQKTQEVSKGGSVLAQADQLTKDLYAQRDRYNFFKVLTLCTLCLIVFIVVIVSLSRRPEPSGGNIVKATGLILVVFGTIFLVLVAEKGQQLTAPIGILGAIAGYLFGAASRQDAASGPSAPPAPPKPPPQPAGP